MKTRNSFPVLPSPMKHLDVSGTSDRIQLSIKRDDLIHPLISGNKWRKLDRNIKHTKENGYAGILSFGGFFSNHLYALASACNSNGLHGVGIVRGNDYSAQNPTLQYLRKQHMALHYISRTEFRKGLESQAVQRIINEYREHFVIPLGGSNELALEGLKSLCDEIEQQASPYPDYIVCACGTGLTAAGLLKYSRAKATILGIPVLNLPNLERYILTWAGEEKRKRLRIMDRYQFGGIGKFDQKLLKFMHKFYDRHSIVLDIVYTAKSMFALDRLLEQKYFEPNSTVIFVHTGGIQGNAGFDVLNPGLLSPALVPQ